MSITALILSFNDRKGDSHKSIRHPLRSLNCKNFQFAKIDNYLLGRMLFNFLIFFLIWVCIPSKIYTEPLRIEFSDLIHSDFQGKEVIIRGFLYRHPSGRLILAPQPNLKSCCVGAAKSQEQIDVGVDLELLDEVADLKGILHIKSPFNTGEEVIGHYFLKGAVILDDKASINKFWITILSTIVIFIVIYILYRYSKYS